MQEQRKAGQRNMCAKLRYATLCYAMLRYVTLCYVMLCYVMQGIPKDVAKGIPKHQV